MRLRSSAGCVYKGRWKGAMVAIKVLEHALILQDDITRETLLSTSIAHPGVVCTFPPECQQCGKVIDCTHSQLVGAEGMWCRWSFV